MEIIETRPEPSEKAKKTKFVISGKKISLPRLEETYPTEEEKIDPNSLSKEVVILQYARKLNSSQYPIPVMVIAKAVYKEHEVSPTVVTKIFLKLWRAGLVRRFFPIARDLKKARRKEGTYYLIHNMNYILPENKIEKKKRPYPLKTIPDSTVIEIRRLAQDHLLKDVAAMFPEISYTHIQNIVNYKGRKNVVPNK